MLFGTEDYRAVTVERIVRAADVTTPVFYDHFTSKRGLYEELLLQHGQQLVAATTVVAPSGSLHDVLQANVTSFFAWVETHPGAWRMLFLQTAEEPGTKVLHEQIQAAASARLAETLVAHAGPLRLSVTVAPEQAAQMFAELGKSALNGLAAWWWEHRDVDREVVAAIAFDLLWHGVDRLSDGGDPQAGRGSSGGPCRARTRSSR